MAGRHFRHHLEGRNFAVFTDHKPLTYALQSSSGKYSPREIAQLDTISQFTADIRYVKGLDNPVADALSRSSINAISWPNGIDLKQMADKQEETVTQSTSNSLKLERVPLTTSDGFILSDVSTGRPRPLVPPSMRRAVIDCLHGLAHPGVRATLKMISSRFVWPRMNEDVRNWAKTCVKCQQPKVSRHTKSTIGTFAFPDARFRHLHMDLVGPLSPSKGSLYILTIVDRYTRLHEAIPIPDSPASTVVSAFMHRCMSIFGPPQVITTDRGLQFESALLTSTCNFLAASRVRTTAYYSAANGMVERFHRQLKASHMCLANLTDWYENLPLVLLALVPRSKKTCKCSHMHWFSQTHLVFRVSSCVLHPRIPQALMTTLLAASAGSYVVTRPSSLVPQCKAPLWTLI